MAFAISSSPRRSYLVRGGLALSQGPRRAFVFECGLGETTRVGVGAGSSCARRPCAVAPPGGGEVACQSRAWPK
jgi:hypothetical protein